MSSNINTTEVTVEAFNAAEVAEWIAAEEVTVEAFNAAEVAEWIAAEALIDA